MTPTDSASPATSAVTRAVAGAGNPFGAILDVSAALVSSLDLDDVFDTVAERIGEAMMVWGVEIQSYDTAAGTLTHEASWCHAGLSDGDRERLGETVELGRRGSLGEVLTHKQVAERRVDDPALPHDERRYLESRGFKTALYAPLVVGGVTLGLLTAIERRFVRHFTSIESDLFRQLCDIAAAAINNAQLYRSLDRQKRQTALLETTQVLTSSLEIEEVLATVLQIVADTFGIDSADIYELADNALVCVASCYPDAPQEADEWLGTVLTLDDHPGYRRVFEDKTVIDYHADTELRRSDPDLYAEMIKWGELSVTEIGLFFGDEVLGCLSLCSRRGVRRLTDNEKEYLVALSSAAAVGIRNAHMYRHRTALLDAGRAVTATTDLEEVLARTTREATLALKCSQAAVYFYDAEFDTITCKALYVAVEGPKPDDDLESVFELADYPSDRSILLGRELVVEQLDDRDLPADRRDTMVACSEHTTLNVPLWFGDEPLGILRLYEMQRPRRFTQNEIELADGLGEQAAGAIHSAKGYAAAAQRQLYLDSLLGIARSLSTCPDAASACAAITRACAQAFEAPRAIVYEYQAGADMLVARASFEAGEAPGNDTGDLAKPVDITPGDRAILDGREAVVEQVSDETLNPQTRAEMERWGEGTCLNIPLRFRDEPVGILMLVWTVRERRLRRDELEFAMAIGEQTALALYAAGPRETDAAGGSVARPPTPMK